MIGEFLARIGKEGLARPTLFMVEMEQVPNLMGSTAGMLEVQSNARFYAESAELPGTHMTALDHRYYDMTAKFVYGKVVDDLNITFRLDRQYNVKKFLDAWIDTMYNRESGNVAYKKDYVGTVRVSQMAENGECFYSTKFHDAFPTQVQPIQLGWDQKGSYQKVVVVFSYRKWTVELREGFYRATNNTHMEHTGNTGPSLDVMEANMPQGFNTNNLLDMNQYISGNVNTLMSRVTPSIGNLINRRLG